MNFFFTLKVPNYFLVSGGSSGSIRIDGGKSNKKIKIEKKKQTGISIRVTIPDVVRHCSFVRRINGLIQKTYLNLYH